MKIKSKVNYKCGSKEEKAYQYKDEYQNKKAKNYVHGYDDHETIGTTR